MTPEEAKGVADLAAEMTTRCMGRYLIDLPERFKLFEYSETKIEGVTVAVRPMEKLRFESFIEAKKATLQRQKLIGEDTPSLLATIPLQDQHGFVFNRSRDGHSAALRTLELNAWRGGYFLDVRIDARDMKFSTMKIEGDTRTTDVDQKLAHLLKVYARLSGRKDTEIPTEQGLCFANGFMKGPPSDEEEVMIRHLLDQVPDVSTTFRSLSGLEQDTELLDRGKSIDAMLKAEEGRTVRKGKAQAQLPGAQEWLMTKKNERTGLWRHHMTLEANAKTGSAQTPVLIFNFGSGGDYSTTPKDLEEEATRPPLKANTFTEAQSVALWDKITATLRPRPGAF